MKNCDGPRLRRLSPQALGGEGTIPTSDSDGHDYSCKIELRFTNGQTSLGKQGLRDGGSMVKGRGGDAHCVVEEESLLSTVPICNNMRMLFKHLMF